MKRLNRINNHIISDLNSNNDIVIVYAKRTPICSSKKGLLKEYAPEDLLSILIKDMLETTDITPSLIDEICIGNVLMPGSGALCARQAGLLAGLPNTVSVSSLNRQCSSGLQSIATIANAIKCGTIDIGIAGGVEMMSLYNMMEDIPKNFSKKLNTNNEVMDCMLPMGITSENVAKLDNISREEQDNFALRSNQKALSAISSSNFINEIVPIDNIREDQCPRVTTLEKLSKLKPSFDPNGSSTAGNSSQISDGASILLMMKRSDAILYNMRILGKFIDYVTVGVPPKIMGIGPVYAINRLLNRNGLNVNDIDQYEINEAFASQCLYCQKKLGIPDHKLNLSGGAIALGHPLGCTGARMTATLLNNLKKNNHNLGIVSMCVGTGMGAAALFSKD